MRNLILTALFLISCTGGKTYTPIDMFQMAYEFDNTIEEVRVHDPADSIKCHSYPEGCVPLSPKRFKVRLVEIVVVQYESQKLACLAAKKLKTYYARNWLFDDVVGEPVLEDFVKKVYQAKIPKDCP